MPIRGTERLADVGVASIIRAVGGSRDSRLTGPVSG